MMGFYDGFINFWGGGVVECDDYVFFLRFVLDEFVVGDYFVSFWWFLIIGWIFVWGSVGFGLEI